MKVMWGSVVALMNFEFTTNVLYTPCSRPKFVNVTKGARFAIEHPHIACVAAHVENVAIQIGIEATIAFKKEAMLNN